MHTCDIQVAHPLCHLGTKKGPSAVCDSLVVCHICLRPGQGRGGLRSVAARHGEGQFPQRLEAVGAREEGTLRSYYHITNGESGSYAPITPSGLAHPGPYLQGQLCPGEVQGSFSQVLQLVRG